jgi:hypothetical protein
VKQGNLFDIGKVSQIHKPRRSAPGGTGIGGRYRSKRHLALKASAEQVGAAMELGKPHESDRCAKVETE